jgi:hypothetical protein
MVVKLIKKDQADGLSRQFHYDRTLNSVKEKNFHIGTVEGPWVKAGTSTRSLHRTFLLYIFAFERGPPKSSPPNRRDNCVEFAEV